MAQTRIPITIITGFAGAGKTTLILNLLPQLRALHPSPQSYNLALIKNEIGDLAVDTALAAAAELTASKELLGDCICCTNIGQIEDALNTLADEFKPDRIVIETSGSAEPLKLVLEINRLARKSGRWELDGVVSVLDAPNWAGYAGKGYTAELQARETDLVVVNKWEGMGEREFDDFVDRLGDLDTGVPWIRSDRGKVSPGLLFGFDSKMAKAREDEGGHAHEHKSTGHQEEVECLSVSLTSDDSSASVDLDKLQRLLESAPKDEVFRIKAVVYSKTPPPPANNPGAATSTTTGSNGSTSASQGRRRYVLNWSFGRWTWSSDELIDDGAPVLRMSIFTAQYESTKWTKKVESGGFIALGGSAETGKLEVKRVQ